MMRVRAERPGVSFCRHLSAFAAQLLHACSDHSKIISGAGSGALAAQLLHACPDDGKIISGAGSGHVYSVYFMASLGRRSLTIPSGVSRRAD